MKDYTEEQWKNVVETFKSDIKILTLESLEDCLRLAEENKGDPQVDELTIFLKEEFESRKSKNQSTSWLEDVFGGDE